MTERHNRRPASARVQTETNEKALRAHRIRAPAGGLRCMGKLGTYVCRYGVHSVPIDRGHKQAEASKARRARNEKREASESEVAAKGTYSIPGAQVGSLAASLALPRLPDFKVPLVPVPASGAAEDCQQPGRADCILDTCYVQYSRYLTPLSLIAQPVWACVVLSSHSNEAPPRPTR